MTETMPDAQKKAIAELLNYLKGNYYPNAKIVGHREIGSSNCPGDNYPLEELKNYKTLLKEDESMTAEEKTKFNALVNEVERLNEKSYKQAEEIEKLKNPMIYNYIDSNMPGWAHEGVQFCLDKGIIQGTGRRISDRIFIPGNGRHHDLCTVGNDRIGGGIICLIAICILL